MEKNRGYSMPLLPKEIKEQTLWIEFLLFPLIILIGILTYNNPMSDGIMDNLEWLELIALMVVFGTIFLCILAEFFVKLHFVPEGIAVTLFGITIYRRSAARIWLITAVKLKGAAKIALCNYSLNELTTRSYYSKPELLRNSQEYWEGEWAHEYLLRNHPQQKKRLPRDHLIYWIWWDPERLQALRSLYPHAQWIDVTERKIFEKQLKELSSNSQ